MGLKTTWVCVNGVGKAALLQSLGLVETGEEEGFLVAKIAVAELPDGWTILHYGKSWALKPDDASTLFSQGEVIWGMSSETVMFSEAHMLVDGREVWSVEHNCERGPDDLKVEGTPPGELEAVSTQIKLRQAESGWDDVDFVFETPMALTEALTGYDPMRQQMGPDFRVVEPIESGAAGERQAARIALLHRMAEAIRTDLVPLAQSMGFQRASDVAPIPQRPLGVRTLVRFRDGLRETLDFEYGLYDGVAKIPIRFFVEEESKTRSGSAGQAIVPPPKRRFMETFTGRKPEADDVALARRSTRRASCCRSSTGT